MEHGIPVYQDYEYVDLEESEFAEEEFYADQFYSQEYENILEEGGLAPFSLTEIIQHCIQPTVTDGVKHMGKILLWSLIFRLLTQTVSTPNWTKHAASIVTGTLLACNFFNASIFYLLGLITFGYVVLAVSLAGVRGPVVAAMVLSFNLVCETWLADPVSWHQVRGAVMICSMKIISVGFDIDEGQRKKTAAKPAEVQQEPIVETKGKNGARHRTGRLGKSTSDGTFENRKTDSSQENTIKQDQETLITVPGWFEFAGYCLCPGTVVLGPWIPFSQYLAIFIQPKWNLNWITKIVCTVFFSLMFLTISTCWNPWLIPDNSWKWWIAYRDAMSFRASHYFVSFMSEAAAVSAGLGAAQVGASTLWQLQVTLPHNIEVPRSLVDVVVSWNLPMHAWLKKYVFKPTRKGAGAGMAVFATYFASTLLHGLSAQLGAVLFSLGLYTWVEHTLRGKLARIINASIEARRDTDEKYRHREGTAWVILINLGFGLMAMFHLAYLGVMFDQSPESSAGYSWSHTLAKWRNLDYTSHYVVAAQLLINGLL